MARVPGALIVAIAFVGAARADLVPPKGLRPVPVEHVIQSSKDYPDYAFFVVSGTSVAAVKLTPKAPLVIPALPVARARTYTLVAVPKNALKQYPTIPMLSKAIANRKVTGLVASNTSFSAFTELRLNDPRQKVTEGWRIETITQKDGIVISQVKIEKRPRESPEDENSPKSVGAKFGPESSVWIAGLAGALGVVLAGLWLARRSR